LRAPFITREPKSPLIDHRWLRVWLGVLVCLGIGVSGCSIFKLETDQAQPDILKAAIAKVRDRTKSKASAAKPVGEKVRLAGGLALGQTDNLAFTPEAMASLLSELIDSEKWNSVRRLVRLYPDIISNLLIDSGSELPPSQLNVIAKFFDDQWSGDDKQAWQEFVKSKSNDADMREFLQARAKFLSLLETNEPESAFDLRIAEKLPKNASPIVFAESHRLEGIGHLIAGNHRKSVDRLSQAFTIVKTSQPYQASQIGLLLGEAQRHAGDTEAWQTSWESAINIQSRWLAERGLSDPAFWSKAAFLRPVSTPWPSDVIRRLEHSLRDENLVFSTAQTSASEAVVWAIVGTKSLKRHEAQNAILAFKKCEALVSSQALKEELQMQQALAMIDSGQQGPASAILIRLGSQPSLLGDRSKAILATLKLQNGSLAQGMNLLQSAIKTSNQWPTNERLRAQADYGLAFLMRGKEEQGIALLNQVHQEFLEEKQFDHAAQCLENIATYYEETDQPAKYRTAESRVKSIEAY
jgi:hypothetical protein